MATHCSQSGYVEHVMFGSTRMGITHRGTSLITCHTQVRLAEKPCQRAKSQEAENILLFLTKQQGTNPRGLIPCSYRTYINSLKALTSSFSSLLLQLLHDAKLHQQVLQEPEHDASRRLAEAVHSLN